jgi:hypothetical protein
MSFWRIACVVFLSLASTVSLGLRPSASSCVVSGPRYRLMAEAVDWSTRIGSGQGCIRDLRLNTALSVSPNVVIEDVKLISPPQSGQVTMQGSGFSYTAKSDFQGEDSFTVLVSGSINRIPGVSTIRFVVSVVGAPSLHAVPASRVHLPAPASVSQLGISPDGGALSGTSWRALKIGAGGVISGIDIAADGTKFIRTDVYGAYLYNESTNLWQQVVTLNSMPRADAGLGLNAGVYSIAIAPSNTQRFYMMFNGYVYRSENRGTTWTRTAFSKASADPNGDTRSFGRTMAVDPANADVVYAGTPASGLFVSTNAGASWTQISAVGSGSVPSGKSEGGANLIAFDPASNVSGGKTQGIYVSTYGTGVYHSTDGGMSWTLTTGTPKTHNHMIVDANGIVWLVDFISGGHLQKYSGSWSLVAGAGSDCVSVAVDPANSNHIFVGTSAGKLVISTNSGSTWVGPTAITQSSADIRWLAWQEQGSGANGYMSNADMVFDASVANTLYQAMGLGVFTTNPPTANTTVAWTSKSAGIEELVANWIISPPGGKPVVSVWDQGTFYVADPAVYPSTHGVTRTKSLSAGWQIDYASSSPSTIVCNCNFFGSANDTSGLSTDGGMTWSTFASQPGGVNIGGSIAASTPTNFVLVRTDAGAGPNQLYYTMNGGGTWNAVAISGVPISGETGWGFAYYMRRHVLAADRVDANTFYIVNYGPKSAPSAKGLYRSTDGGATWGHVYTGSALGGFNPTLKTVPGRSGHLFYSLGSTSGPHPNNDKFFRSTDHGATWNAVPGVSEVWTFGFGKMAPGESYPAIYIFGWVGGAVGIWRSDDNAVTWIRLSDGFPLSSFDQIVTMEGDANTYGTVYVGFAGSGFAYGHLN